MKPSVTRDPNFKSIRQYALELLQGGKCMSFDQLSKAILAAGYKSNSENYFDQCHKKLNLMLQNGEVVKDTNDHYSLNTPVGPPPSR